MKFVIKKSEAVALTKEESETLLNHWLRQRAKYCYENDPDMDHDEVVEEVFDDLIDHWLNQPTLLFASRKVDLDKEWISGAIQGVRQLVIDEKEEIIREAEEYKNTPPVTTPVTPYFASVVTLDEKLENLVKARTKGAKDKLKRKRKAVSIDQLKDRRDRLSSIAQSGLGALKSYPKLRKEITKLDKEIRKLWEESRKKK